MVDTASTNTAYDRAVAYAAERGRQDGGNAAGWYVQDAFGGRVTRGNDDAARRILAGIDAGDPAVLDTLPRADLSGQWADTLTGPALVADALDVADVARDRIGDRPEDAAWFHDICDAYECAFADAAEDAIASAARGARRAMSGG